MFKLPITYTTYDGTEKTKDFYFNLTKGEIAELNYEIPGGFDAFLDRIKDDPEVSDIVQVFKKLILKSYGRRNAENKFEKSDRFTREFAASDAYSELFLKFLENEDGFVDKFLENAIGIPTGKLQETLQENTELKETVEAIQSSEF